MVKLETQLATRFWGVPKSFQKSFELFRIFWYHKAQLATSKWRFLVQCSVAFFNFVEPLGLLVAVLYWTSKIPSLSDDVPEEAAWGAFHQDFYMFEWELE